MGRIRLSVNEHESIYLSIRSVNKHKYFKLGEEKGKLYDHDRVINDLINKRPYLLKYMN